MKQFKVNYFIVSEHEDIIYANNEEEAERLTEYEYETYNHSVDVLSVEELD